MFEFGSLYFSRTESIFLFAKKKVLLYKKAFTVIGTKFAPPYSILFVPDLEERSLQNFDLKMYVWWCYIDFFSLGNMGKKY